MDVIERTIPQKRDAMTLALLPDLDVVALDGRDSDLLGVYSAILTAARANPKLAFQGLSGLTDAEKIPALVRVCEDGLSSPRTEANEGAWIWGNRPKPDLASAADALEGAVKADTSVPAIRPWASLVLAGCRAFLGDLAGVDRALALTSSEHDPAARLFALTVGRRFEEALVVAATAKAADVKAPAASQWPLLQHERERLLWAAKQTHRADIADQTAQAILRSALATDRPSDTRMDSGVPAALAWIESHGHDPAQAEPWVRLVDAAVKPGLPGWNYEDAIAVHRSWTTIKQPDLDHALVLYNAVAAEAAKAPGDANGAAAVAEASKGATSPPGVSADAANRPLAAAAYGRDAMAVRLTMAEMLAEMGHWDEARGLGMSVAIMYLEDLKRGYIRGTFNDRLARAGSVGEKAWLLRACASSWEASQIYQWSPPGVEPVDLELAARCVRDLGALGRLVNRFSDPDGPMFYPNQGPNPALIVAARAVKAGRLEMTREMMALLLPLWRSPAAEDLTLDDLSISLLIHVAAADLRQRGEL